mmetsp:Transcript_12513/g.21104  ORF Transcript_12513/g.21104 Transcript_12513/m.21104 type:complete len:276 (+) Transcript_12513:416-1243(+)
MHIKIKVSNNFELKTTLKRVAAIQAVVVAVDCLAAAATLRKSPSLAAAATLARAHSVKRHRRHSVKQRTNRRLAAARRPPAAAGCLATRRAARLAAPPHPLLAFPLAKRHLLVVAVAVCLATLIAPTNLLLLLEDHQRLHLDRKQQPTHLEAVKNYLLELLLIHLVVVVDYSEIKLLHLEQTPIQAAVVYLDLVKKQRLLEIIRLVRVSHLAATTTTTTNKNQVFLLVAITLNNKTINNRQLSLLNQAAWLVFKILLLQLIQHNKWLYYLQPILC